MNSWKSVRGKGEVERKDVASRGDWWWAIVVGGLLVAAALASFLL